MRQIKASEVKPGMTIRWETQMEIKSTTEANGVGGVLVSGDNRITEYLGSDAKITVLSEPAPAQPEEPTEFGAKARVRDRYFLRMGEVGVGRYVWFEKGSGNRWAWGDLCEMGQVQVVPDQGWTVPAEAPEAPERIEEWPEDDTALRKHKWRDRDGDLWWSVSNSRNPWVVGFADGIGTFHPYPKRGPWTRETDA